MNGANIAGLGGEDKTAQVTFSGGAVRAAHLDRLAKYLELAKLALEAEEEE